MWRWLRRRTHRQAYSRGKTSFRSSPKVSITKAFRSATSNRAKCSFTSNRVRRFVERRPLDAYESLALVGVG